MIVVILFTQSLTLAVLCFFLFHLFRQQGRILLRLDGLEHHTHSESPHTGESQSSGLAVGAAVEEFELPDVNGRRTALTDFSGKRVLLIYWGAECGFCDMAAAELAGMQTQLRANR